MIPRRSPGPPALRPHLVALVVYDGVSPFEVGVICDIFGGDYAGDFGVPWYRLTVCGCGPSVTLDAGFEMQVPHGLEALQTADTVVVLPTAQPGQVPAEVLEALRAGLRRGCRRRVLRTSPQDYRHSFRARRPE